MASGNSITFKAYYSSFKEQFAGIAAIITSILPLGSLVPVHGANYLFPPLGDVEATARCSIVLFAFFATFLAYFAKDAELWKIRKFMFVVLPFAVISLCGYIGFHMLFVRRVPIPTRSIAVQVSVGYERTEFAQSNFPTATDWEILRERGFEEEQIIKLWTIRSLYFARLALFLSYCGALLPLVGGFCLGVVYNLKQRLGLPSSNVA